MQVSYESVIEAIYNKALTPPSLIVKLAEAVIDDWIDELITADNNLYKTAPDLAYYEPGRFIEIVKADYPEVYERILDEVTPDLVLDNMIDGFYNLKWIYQSIKKGFNTDTQLTAEQVKAVEYYYEMKSDNAEFRLTLPILAEQNNEWIEYNVQFIGAGLATLGYVESLEEAGLSLYNVSRKRA
jgi:hypothetical protein